MSEEMLKNDISGDVPEISDDVINNLKPLCFQTIQDADIAEFMHYQCQKVLLLAKKKNASREVALAVNLNTFEVLSPVFGDAGSVNIDFLVSQMKGTDYAFLVMHNHPSGSHFSRRDLKTFVDAENITVLIVLGNDGSIYIVEKTKQLSLNEILSARKTLVDWKNAAIEFETVIEQFETLGIEYSAI